MEISIKNPTQIQQKTNTSYSLLPSLKARYDTYIQKQDQYKVYWYMKVVLVMTNVHMIISTFAMAELVDKFEYYIGFTIIVFFTNILVHIVQFRSNVFVPVYYISLGLFVIIPLITFAITSIL